MHSIFVNTAILSFAAGIAWQDVFKLNTAFAVFLLMLGFALALTSTKAQIAKPCFAICVMGILAFTLGVVRMEVAQDAANVMARNLDEKLGSKVELVGIIAGEPDVREYTTSLVVQAQGGALVLVKARPHQEFTYGDEVLVRGVLEKPQNFTGDTGREFDYVGYLAKDKIKHMLKYPHIEVLGHGNGSPVRARLFAIKQRYIEALSALIPEPQAGLAAGITVGAKRALGSELMGAFRNTGLIHIVVLSGFNVTIIIIFLLRVLAWLPRTIKYSLAAAAVVLFALLTGADAPVVRASAMGLLGVAAVVLGRTYTILRALMLVALAMVVWNPYILLHDIAFQLSVVATLGLIFLSPKIIYWLSPRHIQELSQQVLVESEIFPSLVLSAVEIIGITIAAQIAVLPLLIYYMGEVSVVAVVVNVLALPIIPLAMLLVFIAGVVGMASTAAALPFAYGAYGLLAYIVWLVEFFNALPITTLQIF